MNNILSRYKEMGSLLPRIVCTTGSAINATYGLFQLKYVYIMFIVWIKFWFILINIIFLNIYIDGYIDR